eukprot:COSAG03_NODE_350_length_8727_cov_145.845913_7_plen_889_part_00
MTRMTARALSVSCPVGRLAPHAPLTTGTVLLLGGRRERGSPTFAKKRVATAMAYQGEYTGTDEEQAIEWIEDALDLPLDEAPLGDVLKSGVVLCNLVNRLSPGAVKKISGSKMPFPQRENVQAFISAVRTLGVPDRENFDTSDLFEQTGMRQVMICLRSLGRAAYNIPGYEGPCWGQQESGGSGPRNHQVKTDGGLWGKAGGGFGSVGGGVQVDASSRGVTPPTAEPARKGPPPRRRAAPAPAPPTLEVALDEAAAAREDRVAALATSDDAMKSAQQMILATLEGEGGSCRYSRLFEEAAKQKCGVLADALLSCKRASPPLVSYDGMMLLMPAHKDTIITLGAPQATPRPQKQPPTIPKKAAGSGPPAIPNTKTSPGKTGPPPVPRAAAPSEELRTYRSLRRAVIRTGFDMESDNAGVLEKRQVVKALEARRNENGVLRVRFAAGWVSSTTADGSLVLEVMSAAEAEAEALAAAVAEVGEKVVAVTTPVDPEPAAEPAAESAPPALTPRASGFGLSKMRNFVCVKKTVIRSGFDMDSDKAGVLAVGSVIVPQRKQANENGIHRIKFSQGWVSMVTSDGDTIMEPSDLPPTDLSATSAPAAATSATAVGKVDTSDNARSRWNLPGVGPAAPTDEFADTDSTVESISVAGKVVDAGDKQASLDAVGSLTPVAAAKVLAAVQVPGVVGEKDYTAYLVECTGLSGDKWVLAKRFSDFVALRDELIALGLDEASAWDFPSKMTFFKSDEEVQAERVSGFEKWLSLVLARREVNAADEKAVLMFFRPDPVGKTPTASSAAERPLTPREPVTTKPSSEPTAPAEEVIGAYTVVLKSVVRAGFGMDSEKVGTVKKGEEVLCYEERENENGVTRVRFDRGWVSLTSSKGDVILEAVE